MPFDSLRRFASQGTQKPSNKVENLYSPPVLLYALRVHTLVSKSASEFFFVSWVAMLGTRPSTDSHSHPESGWDTAVAGKE